MSNLKGRFHWILFRARLSTGMLTVFVPFFHIFLGISQFRGTLPENGLTTGLFIAGLFALLVSWGMRHRRWGFKYRFIFLAGLFAGTLLWSVFFGTGETPAGRWSLDRYMDWILMLAQGMLSALWYDNLSGRSLLIRRLAPFSGEDLIKEKRKYNEETGFSLNQSTTLMVTLGVLALATSLTSLGRAPGFWFVALWGMDALVWGLLAWYRHEVDLLVLGLRHGPGVLPRHMVFLGLSALVVLTLTQFLPLESLPAYPWDQEARRMLVAEADVTTEQTLDSVLRELTDEKKKEEEEPLKPLNLPGGKIDKILQNAFFPGLLVTLGWFFYRMILWPLRENNLFLTLIRFRLKLVRLWGKARVFLKNLFRRKKNLQSPEPETWNLRNSHLYLLNQPSGKKKKSSQKTYPVLLSGLLKVMDWAGSRGIKYLPGETAGEFLTRAGASLDTCRTILERIAQLFNQGSFSGKELEKSELGEFQGAVETLVRGKAT